MNTLHLTSYLSSSLFLEEVQNMKLPYDAIFSDITYEDCPLPFYGIADKPEEKNLIAYWEEKIASAQCPLFIL